MWLTLALAVAAAGAACLLAWRLADFWRERTLWNDLLRAAGPPGPAFDHAMLSGLPEPAQRYLRYAITEGTPIVSAIEIEMDGELGLGTREAPGYRPMTAHQILVPPQGLLWRLRSGFISGSDAATPDTSWTRFWLAHLVPIARVSGNDDHHRSAFGRVAAEGAFWAPASLLPRAGAAWESVDDNTARATISCGRYSQAIDLTVEADGQPSRVVIQRWSNANADGVFRTQPFGGYLSGFRLIEGYRLPMQVEGGNLIGTPEYFPFYKANVRSIRFPQLVNSRNKPERN